MAASEGSNPIRKLGVEKPSEEFASFCEAEFERRLNSGEAFDEKRYRKAMTMVMDRLLKVEAEARR